MPALVPALVQASEQDSPVQGWQSAAGQLTSGFGDVWQSGAQPRASSAVLPFTGIPNPTGVSALTAAATTPRVESPKPKVPPPPMPVMICSRGSTYALDVKFDSGRTRLEADEIVNLSKLIPKITLRFLEVVIVVGHTDSQGNEAANRMLSKQRAEEVKSFFMSRGIPSEHIWAESHGSARPVAANNTVKGRAMNRRVEVEILTFRDNEQYYKSVRSSMDAERQKQAAEAKLSNVVTQ